MIRNLFFFVVSLVCYGRAGAQAPQISYLSPETYVVGNAITPLKPVNTGGAVPMTNYGETSTFANGGVYTAIFTHFNLPISGAFDANGNLFVADQWNYAIRKVTPTGVASSLTGSAGAYDFLNGNISSARFKEVKGLVFDSFGNMYVVDRGNYRIRKISTDGIVSTFAGNATSSSVDGNATLAGFKDLMAIAIDQQDNLYVIDGNLVRKINPSADVTTLAGKASAGSENGTGNSASFNGPTGLAVNKNGHIMVADEGNNLIRKITPEGTVTTFAGSTLAGYADGDVNIARFNSPSGISIDNIGNIYIGDGINMVVRKIDANNVVSTVSGNSMSGLINGAAASAKFNFPMGLIPDNKGSLFVMDQRNNLVRKVVLTGFTISPALPAGLTFDGTTGTISGSAQAPLAPTSYKITAYNAKGSSVTTVSISASEMSAPVLSSFWPHSVLPGQNIQINGANLSTTTAVDVGGVAASFHILSATSLTVTVPAGVSTSGIKVTNNKGSATISGFKVLTVPRLAVSGSSVLKMGIAITPITINNTGGDVPAQLYHQVSDYAGSRGIGFANGENFIGTFDNPRSILFDDMGNLFIADKRNEVIRKITRNGVISTFAGNRLRSMADGQGTNASFSAPSNIVMDKAGNIFVADYLNQSIRKITPSGRVSTFVTNLGPADVIAIDKFENLYVANYRVIRKITPDGTVTNFAGRSTSGLINGPRETSAFNDITAMAFDAAGDMYIVDNGNDQVRKINAAGIVSSYAGVPNSTSAQQNGPAATATFWGMGGIAIDNKGNIYIGENYGVRMISADGMVSSLTEGKFKNGAYSNGDFSDATFSTGNQALCFDVFGDLYISGGDNGYIRKATLTGYNITPKLPAGLSFDLKTGVISGTPTAAGTGTEYTILAYNAAGNSSVKFAFTPEGAASIASFSPASAGSGTTVTITGANLSGTTAVSFGGVPALSFTVNSSTRITAIIAAGATGNLTLTTPSGTVIKSGFTYTNTNTQVINFVPLNPVNYGVGSITLTGTASSALPVKYTSSDPAIVKITGVKAQIIGAGTVTITASQEGDDTYHAAATVTRTLVIDKAILSIKAENSAKTYGSVNPVFTMTYIGFVSGDDESKLGMKPKLITEATATSGVGVYDIVPSGAGAAANYNINYIKGVLTVLPASLTIRINNVSKTYGSVNPVFTMTYIGFVNGDNELHLTTPATLSTAAGISSPAGSYSIFANGATSSNYDIIYVTGWLTIIPPPLPVISTLSNDAGKTGTNIKITGSNFQNTITVTFGGKNASSFTVTSSTVIDAVVGEGASGDIIVTTQAGSVHYPGFMFLLQPYITANSATTILTGGSIALKANPNDVGSSYQWFKDGEPIKDSTLPDLTVTQGGSYHFTSTYKGINQRPDAIRVTEVFSLPATNFKLSVNSVTCRGGFNGLVNIEASKHLDYTAAVTGNGINRKLTFTSSLQVNNLPSGTYDICLTIAGQPNYRQCFTAVVTEPKDLTVYADVVNAGKQVVLSLGGSNSYHINLNGKTVTTKDNQVTLPLRSGANQLTVTADSFCQGVFEKVIQVKPNIVAFPNPFNDVLNLDLGEHNIKDGTIKIYNMLGKDIYILRVSNKSGVLPIDLSTLPSGNYILKLLAENMDTVIRIIKK
jgi:hypothetical protein